MGNLPILQFSTGDKRTEFGWCERRGHSISADVVDYAFKALKNENATPDDIQVYHWGKCCVGWRACSRKLLN